jgi:glucose-1-phosphatase
VKKQSIKNIIFDLGNVVIDIAPLKTYEAFANLSKSKNATEVEKLIKENNLWLGYEKGLISETDFRDLIRLHLDIEATDNQIDSAFNALLLDVDPARINLIERLSKKYRIFVLSNTSQIHMIEFLKIIKRCTNRSEFWELFEKPYLSFEMGKLKPELEIYQQVLSESNLVASETLFIDDLKANIEAANNLNINTIHLQAPFTIIDHLNDF